MTYPPTANNSRAVSARLMLRGHSARATVHYHCVPAESEPSMLDFEIALATRLAVPILIMWLVAKIVLRGRLGRRRRRGTGPSTPSYQTLREDAEVVITTLAALPLVPYKDIRALKPGQRIGEAEGALAGGNDGGNEALAPPAANSRVHFGDADACVDAVAAVDAGAVDAGDAAAGSSCDIEIRVDGDLAQECGICLDQFIDEQYLRVLPCAHFFCAECIDRWFETRGLSGQVSTRGLPCPMCKADAR